MRLDWRITNVQSMLILVNQDFAFFCARPSVDSPSAHNLLSWYLHRYNCVPFGKHFEGEQIVQCYLRLRGKTPIESLVLFDCMRKKIFLIIVPKLNGRI